MDLKIPNHPAVYIVGGVLFAVAVVKLLGGRQLGEAAGGVVSGSVAAVDGFIGEAVPGVAEPFGIPRTDAAKCAAAKRAGDVLGASLYCPAAEFIGWAAQGMPSGGASGEW